MMRSGRSLKLAVVVFCIIFAAITLSLQRSTGNNEEGDGPLPQELVLVAQQENVPLDLMIVIPFTKKESSLVIRRIAKWKNFLPCHLDDVDDGDREGGTGHFTESDHTTLVFYFSRTFSTEPTLRRALAKAVSESKVAGCFFSINYVSAELKEEEDVYDKLRRSSKWAEGPNQMFYRLTTKSDETKLPPHDYTFWMEPDTQPLQSNWLGALRKEIDAHHPFWMMGSAFLGLCGVSPRACRPLGRNIAAHINGNAVYSNAKDFRDVLVHTRQSEWKNWPFDLAIYLYIRDGMSEFRFRRSLTKYIHTSMIENYGSYPFDMRDILENRPQVVFVHGRRPDGTLDVPVANDGPDLHASDDIKYPMPDDEAAAVLKERVRQSHEKLFATLSFAADSNQDVMLTFLSSNYIEMFRNFWLHTKTAQIRNLLVVALDDRSQLLLNNIGLSSFRLKTAWDSTENWASDNYKSAGFRKAVNIRYGFLSICLWLGFNVLLTDVDAVWLQNPFPYLQNAYDFQPQTDARRGFEEGNPTTGSTNFMNGGVHFSKGNKHMAMFFELVNDKIEAAMQVEAKRNVYDQVVLNSVLTENVYGITWRALDPVLYPNGHVYFSEKLPQSLGVTPLVVHNNWVNGLETKKYRFREAGLWVLDGSEYYDTSDERFLCYDEPVEDNGLNNQWLALRSAMAIAILLNRTLILPPIFPYHHSSDTRTYDYAFDYDALKKHFPQHRPHSFLQHAFSNPDPVPLLYIDIGYNDQPPGDVKVAKVVAEKGYLGASDSEIMGLAGNHKGDRLIKLYRTFRRYCFEDDDCPSDISHKTGGQRSSIGKLLNKAIRPNSYIQSLIGYVTTRIKEKFPKFNCFHFRRGDFLKVHANREKPTKGVVALLKNLLPTTTPLFIVTNDVTESLVFKKDFHQVLNIRDFLPEWETKPLIDSQGRTSQLLGMIEMYACAHATNFVGNVYSTFTRHICQIRRKELGNDDSCTDIYGEHLPHGSHFFV